ncbi:MAG: hypothetical protein PHD76_02380 [Methylacidiphilales bacterium]|nr:hypothetical protein [Candidatus Methylacidiphilales bacterium]
MASPEPTASSKHRLRPTTYSVAVYVVALFLLFELVALGLVFWFRQSVRIETNAPELGQSTPTLSLAAPVLESVPNLPKPDSGRLSVAGRDEKIEREIQRLNDEAQRFRRNGDFALADAALKQAMELDGNHPQTLANFAMLEEARGNSSRALAYWTAIIKLGDSAGKTIQLARERASLIEEKTRLEEEARLREKLVLNLKRMIILDNVKTYPDPLPETPVEIQKDFYLKRSNKTLKVDPGKLKIQLFFYNRVGDNKLVPAKIEARFLSNPPDWSSGDTEILRARYFPMPKGGAEKSFYYGYLIRVYYDGELQDEQADPLGLLRLFPTGT